jgi:hypothetical protein
MKKCWFYQWAVFVLMAGVFANVSGCGGSGDSVIYSAPESTRSWKMGFYYTPPRFGDVALALENIDRFSARAEVVMIHEELPWDLLLDGATTMDDILDTKRDLIAYLKSKGLNIYFMADLTDGLSRGEEPSALRRLGRSIAEVTVQQRYRDYVLGFVTRFEPEYVGLTAETNLVRLAAEPAVYAAMVQAANAAAADLVSAGVTTPLSISVQVETAWGVLGGNGTYEGIEQDLVDFPFVQLLGLSSYPYFGYSTPENIPDAYYSRLLSGRSLPVVICEGGWASVSAGSFVSSPQLQARYIRRQADLLDSVQARAVIQTLFTDIDLSSVPEPYPDNLPLFTSLGLMVLEGNTFLAKPALAVWDELYARSLE